MTMNVLSRLRRNWWVYNLLSAPSAPQRKAPDELLMLLATASMRHALVKMVVVGHGTSAARPSSHVGLGQDLDPKPATKRSQMGYVQPSGKTR